MTSFGGTIGWGRRPALLVVDLSLGFTSPASPLGSEIDAAVAATARLLEAARASGAPVAFTTVAYDDVGRKQAAHFLAKVPALDVLDSVGPFVEIDPRVAPLAGEPVYRKLFASAFFGTELAEFLTAAAVDTVVIAGASTSGCVRASVVDALQYGFRPVVVPDAVADRDAAAGAANLHDMRTKYADVVDLDAAVAALQIGEER